MAKRPRAVQTPREATVTVRENRTKRQRRSNPQELGDWKAADYNAFDLRFRHDFASDSLIVVPDGLSLENEATLFLHLFDDDLVRSWIQFHQERLPEDGMLRDLTVADVIKYLCVYLYV